MNTNNQNTNNQLQELYRLYLDGTASEEQVQEFFLLTGRPGQEAVLQQLIADTWDELEETDRAIRLSVLAAGGTAAAAAGAKLPAGIPVPAVTSVPAGEIPPGRVLRIKTKWWAAAAAVLLLLGGGFYEWRSHSSAGIAKEPVLVATDIAAGGNKATLTLADGRKITLDSAAEGVLTRQGGTSIVKLADGQLTYRADASGPVDAAKVLYNTVSTPTGGQYRLQLPDGTDVWLNAASSITYPTAFSPTDRMVTISGEAYFEVAHSPKGATPFIVKVRTDRGEEGAVQVLGTHFNIDAYGDEASIRTTLLEGSIKFAARGDSRLLHPGEQISLRSSGELEWNPHADTEQAVAWKNGYFNFTRADIRSVMGQLARWYDLQVVYEGEIPERHFAGGLQRSLPLSRVLTILKENDVKFAITGRKITVRF